MSFEVGDKVIDMHYGKGKVAAVFEGQYQEYPIYVDFENGRTNQYTKEGRDLANDFMPTLYHTEGFTSPSCKEPERKHQFKPFDKVLVRDEKSAPWLCAFFSYELDDRIIGKKKYVTTSCDRWCYCIPYEGNKEKCGKVTK